MSLTSTIYLYKTSRRSHRGPLPGRPPPAIPRGPRPPPGHPPPGTRAATPPPPPTKRGTRPTGPFRPPARAARASAAPLPASPPPPPPPRVRGPRKPRRVDQGHRHPAHDDVRVQIIPRGPRDLRHDGAILPRHPVEQRRFPDVRNPCDRHRRAVPEPAPRLVRPQEFL